MSSNKKPISQKRAEREQSENQVLNRVFAVFLVGLAAEAYLFILYRAAVGTISSMLACYRALGWITWLGLAVMVVGIIVGYLKRGDPKLSRAMTWVTGTGLFLGLSGWIMHHFSNDNRGIVMMCILVPVLAVLALLFLLYQRECFFASLALCGAFAAVWLRSASADSARWRVPMIVAAVLGALILAAAAYVARRAQQNEGKLMGIRLCSLECDYRILYGVFGAAFVCVLLAVALPSIATYLMWALGIVLFAELAYYTTKLM